MRFQLLTLVLPISAAIVFACSDTPTATPKPDAGKTPEVDAAMDAPVVEKNGSHVPGASLLGTKLTAAGFDIKNLNPMADTITEAKTDLTGMRMKGLMDAISEGLGVRCNFCHTTVGADGGIDYKATSEKKNIATKMWDEFVVKLDFKNGDPLFCDSCHSGSAKMLDRAPATISAFMGESYVGLFKRTDGQTHACSTCHGSPFNPEFLPIWAQNK
jgi:hypothetical protein